MNERMNERTRAARRYAVLLRLYPRAHRQRFGAQMLQTFQDHYRDAVESGEQTEARFWLAVAGDESRSILAERVAALTERESRMQMGKRAPTLALTFLAIAAFTWLVGRSFVVFPAQVALWAGLIALDIGLIAILARIAPLFIPQRLMDRRPSWRRVRLALGAVLSAYFIVISLLYALFPVPPQPVPARLVVVEGSTGFDLGMVWLASLPLLGGALGVLTACLCRGRPRRSRLSAGLLALGVGSLAYVASQTLLIVLLWGALQQNLLQSSLEMTYQAWYGQSLGWAQFLNQPLTEQQFIFSNYGLGGFRFVPLLGLAWLIFAGLLAALGSALGAASKRTQAARRAAGAQPTRRIGGARGTLGLTVLFLWVGVLPQLGVYVTRNAIEAAWSSSIGVEANAPFTLNVLGNAFASASVVAWLATLLCAAIWLVMAIRPARTGEAASEGA